jgi:uncharacterized membrane protein
VTPSRLAPALVVGALIGLAIAGYLWLTRVAGGLPACGPAGGCDVVAQSEYATFMGLPVALFGVAYSATLVVLSMLWWRRGERRALLLAYGLGFLGLLVVAYLTYLELFVIHAICIWCVAYGISVVVTFGLAVAAVFRTSPARTIG